MIYKYNKVVETLTSVTVTPILNWVWQFQHLWFFPIEKPPCVLDEPHIIT